MNHDTQPGQALEAPVEGFFKPLAYALILLRSEGYPCVFWGDLYGTAGPDEQKQPACAGGQLADLIYARKSFAYGQQDDYFDTANCLGWVRRGVRHEFATAAKRIDVGFPRWLRSCIVKYRSGLQKDVRR